MSKQSTITSLIVMPLIASAVFLASPAFADNPIRATHKEVRNITNKELIPGTKTKSGVTGTVTSINGSIIIVTGTDNIQYTVDAGSATIMKASGQPNMNPSIVHISDIKVGDAIVVRGVIKDTDISAKKIIDGKIVLKKGINIGGKKMHALKTKTAVGKKS